MSRLAGPVTARCYDPTSGTYRMIAGSPLANTGIQQFTPPGKNSAGEDDRVLVLNRPPDPSAGSDFTANDVERGGCCSQLQWEGGAHGGE
jgi:hypothetical protein